MADERHDPAADKEKAEGSRETVDAAFRDHETREQGITNRSVAEEEEEQRQVPPRGAAKRED